MGIKGPSIRNHFLFARLSPVRFPSDGQKQADMLTCVMLYNHSHTSSSVGYASGVPQLLLFSCVFTQNDSVSHDFFFCFPNVVSLTLGL